MHILDHRQREKLISLSKFEKFGVGQKFRSLNGIIDIDINDIEIIHSFNKARNCYVHRHGIVSELDTSTDSKYLIVNWKKLEIGIRGSDGNIINEKDMPGRYIEKGGRIVIRTVASQKSFAKGSPITFSNQELKEICLCTHMIGNTILENTVKFLEANGVRKDSSPPTSN